jgi:hypothetical protein
VAKPQRAELIANSRSGRESKRPERLSTKTKMILPVGIVPSTEQSASFRGIRVQGFVVAVVASALGLGV